MQLEPIYQEAKDFISENQIHYDLFDMSVIGAVASLIFGEFTRSFQRITAELPGEDPDGPTRKYTKTLIPPIQSIRDILMPGKQGVLVPNLSKHLIDHIRNHPHFEFAADMPIFSDTALKYAQLLMDIRTLSMISEKIVQNIIKKIGLEDPRNEFLLEEDESIKMFENEDMGADSWLDYIADQTILQIMVASELGEGDTITKASDIILQFVDTTAEDRELTILSVVSPMTISMVHFTAWNAHCLNHMDIVKYLTSTTCKEIPSATPARAVSQFTTHPYNEAMLTRIKK